MFSLFFIVSIEKKKKNLTKTWIQSQMFWVSIEINKRKPHKFCAVLNGLLQLFRYAHRILNFVASFY